ncbi:gliding motility-associated C-terminal domain-containing protein [Mucilaginibacter sp. X4EP1]|uniref:T9SS type B sorting domain-containing protein n=1 Tax=Mucilaginibacter sp. X4EP1 TaxID=2723092 RepID=UPI0021673432|nr:gliding motility-associated C-terminal domain-containing protein [Mucilaginibacter sp. X4EP1]MCS3814673.1 gliding motility-associated-like protein [Mucilaginibacter sp. X4EP1]
MRQFIIFFIIVLYGSYGLAQSITHDCNNATLLSQTAEYCSADGQYTIDNLSKSAWFKFVATGYDVSINISGLGSGGTLVTPVVQIFSDCAGTELVGTGLTENNVTTLYKGGLVIGETYYIEITGSSINAVGTFKLCINNYNPIVKAGSDCSSASFICSTAAISQENVVGAGANNDEAKGTCLSVPGQVSESNSVWYKWQASNNGTLVFTITPNSIHDDIDWVLFDLGTTGDCANVNAANAIRCKAGYGVDNSVCPTDSIYYKTGLDFYETDLTEPPGCGLGQNGKVKYVTCQQGHYYGLLVNNFSSGNNGFTLAFTDQQGKAGTATFQGPLPAFTYSSMGDCTSSPQYTFTSTSTNYTSLKWTFGDNASIAGGNTNGPYTLSYTSPGVKTITLETAGINGCTVVAAQQVMVGIKPSLPQIATDKNTFCVNDTVRLTATNAPGLSYQWTGPNGFTSDSSVAVVPVTAGSSSGIYKLVVSDFGCYSDAAYITLPDPLPTPTAAFHTDPSQINALYAPVTVSFINDTFDADAYLWDFGDGTTSTVINPTHTYARKGSYSVKLTASKSNACAVSVVKYSLVIISNNSYIFIPNAFTPNGDGINDLFDVTITNITNYHIQLFTRWGQPIFDSRSIANSWDGTYGGKTMPFGVYYYLIDALSTDGEPIKRSGYITLVK